MVINYHTFISQLIWIHSESDTHSSSVLHSSLAITASECECHTKYYPFPIMGRNAQQYNMHGMQNYLSVYLYVSTFQFQKRVMATLIWQYSRILFKGVILLIFHTSLTLVALYSESPLVKALYPDLSSKLNDQKLSANVTFVQKKLKFYCIGFLKSNVIFLILF